MPEGIAGQILDPSPPPAAGCAPLGPQRNPGSGGPAHRDSRQRAHCGQEQRGGLAAARRSRSGGRGPSGGRYGLRRPHPPLAANFGLRRRRQKPRPIVRLLRPGGIGRFRLGHRGPAGHRPPGQQELWRGPRNLEGHRRPLCGGEGKGARSARGGGDFRQSILARQGEGRTGFRRCHPRGL